MPTGIEKMEEAIGVGTSTPRMPYKKGEKGIPGRGGIAREWTGPRPWRNGKGRQVAGKGDHSIAKPL